MSSLYVLALFGQHKHSRIDNAQTLTLASELAKGGVLYSKSIYWNMFISLPRIVLSFVPVWLLIKHNEGFSDVEKCNIIVVCGRNMIRYAKHLKKHTFKDAKIVQIGTPRCGFAGIDLLLRPKHSNGINLCKNVIRYRGYMCKKISQDIIDKTTEKFQNIKNVLKGPFISVFIGGNTLKYKITPTAIKDFTSTITNISHNMKMPLLICADSNVPNFAINILKNNLDCSYYFYNKKTNPKESPKVAFIEWGDYYIIMGNSIVNQSELISQGKKTYIYYGENRSTKYKDFYTSIIADGCAKPISMCTAVLENFNPIHLNNIEQIANQVIKTLGF